MSQSTAKEHAARVEKDRELRVEGEKGDQKLVTKDPQLQLLQSIDKSLKDILLILQANT